MPIDNFSEAHFSGLPFLCISKLYVNFFSPILPLMVDFSCVLPIIGDFTRILPTMGENR